MRYQCLKVIEKEQLFPAGPLAIAVELQNRQDARAQLLHEKEALLSENQALFHEKDLLMQEVHHRVKNSLQLVQNILVMQARTLNSAEAREQVDKAAERIMTIAAVHHRLHAGGSIVATDAAQYLHGLLGDMRGVTLDVADDRALELDISTFPLAADDIAPLGLIVCELVTNALKYGRGRVQVSVQQDAGGLEISVSDEGGGFPSEFDPASRHGLGMRMISLLAKSSNGDAIRVDRSVPFGRIVVRTRFGGPAN